jgi:hypothetical protein
MRLRIRLLTALLCAALAPLTVKSMGQAGAEDAKDTAAKKDTEKPAERAAEKTAAMTVHVALYANELKELPDGSSIELKPDSESCNKMKNMESDIHSGRATFADVPVCKVKFFVFVTGYNTQSIPVDLLKCKEPITIKIDSQASPKASCS